MAEEEKQRGVGAKLQPPQTHDCCVNGKEPSEATTALQQQYTYPLLSWTTLYCNLLYCAALLCAVHGWNSLYCAVLRCIQAALVCSTFQRPAPSATRLRATYTSLGPRMLPRSSSNGLKAAGQVHQA